MGNFGGLSISRNKILINFFPQSFEMLAMIEMEPLSSNWRVMKKVIFCFLKKVKFCFSHLPRITHVVVDYVSFFTPIPRYYPSLLLDGAARNYLSFYLHGYARSGHLSCLDPFISPTSYARGEKKNTLVRAGIETRSSRFTKNCSNH